MKEQPVYFTVDEKVILHLWDHSRLQDQRDSPFDVTQHGIAAAVGIIRSAVPRSVKKLVEKGLVEETLAHVGHLNRRRKCYYLTKEGRLLCEKLRDRILSSELKLDGDDSDKTVTASELEDATGTAFGPLEIVLDTDENGKFDPAVALARREQLHEFFTQASKLSIAPEDKGTLLTAGVQGEAGKTPSAEGRPAAGPVLVGHPPELQYFFGRGEEMERIQEWFTNERGRVMVVFGLPGMGKSSLGSKFISQNQGREGGLSVLWSRVRQWDTLHTLIGHFTGFLTALGEHDSMTPLTEKGLAGPGEYARTLAEAMGDDRLVVLDDLHTAAQDVRDLVGALFEAMADRSSGKILVITRAIVPFYDRRHVAVDGTVSELELGGLDHESALSLLELKGHDVKGRSADGLVTASGGHPLYLELFEVREGGGMELDAHRDVAQFIQEEVYSRLDDPELLLIERAAVFRYRVPREAFFVDRKADLKALGSLTGRCILHESDGLYDMHEVLRSHVYDNIPAERRRRLHSAAARFYDTLLAAVRPARPSRSRTGEGQREAAEVVHHLLQAWEDSAAADFLRIWGGELVRGPYSDSVETYVERMLEPPGDREPLAPDALTGLRELLGDLYTERGQLDMALATYDGVLRELVGGDDPAGAHEGVSVESLLCSCPEGLPCDAAGVLRKMALIHERKGELSQAFSLLRTAEELVEKVRDLKGHIMNLGSLGWLHWRTGDVAASRGSFDKSMKLLMKLEEMPGRVKEFMSEGLDSARRGELTGALRSFESSMELLEMNEDLFDIMRIYDNIGDQYFKVLVTTSMYTENGDEDEKAEEDEERVEEEEDEKVEDEEEDEKVEDEEEDEVVVVEKDGEVVVVEVNEVAEPDEREGGEDDGGEDDGGEGA